MRERPILFSAPMVNAILYGEKSQTRRIIKPQPDGRPTGWGTKENGRFGERCPHGMPGYRLWVREAIRRDGRRWDPRWGEWEASVFVADESRTKATAWPWKRDTLPGMFMPRGLSRITLEITEVRVQRLQEISEADAIAEGCRAVSMHALDCDSIPPSQEYRGIWESINGAGSWEANPWVWAISFKRLEPSP